MPSSMVDTTRKSTWRLPHVPSSRRYPILCGLIDAFFGLRYQATKFRRFASVEITACSQLLRFYCDYQRLNQPPGMDRCPGESDLEAMEGWLARPLTETEKAAALEEAHIDLRDYSGFLPDQEPLMSAMGMWCP